MRGLLDWLLRPRSVRVVGRRRPADKLQFNKRLAKARGAVELVVVAGARCAPATVNKAAAAARAVVVLPSSGTDACALTDCEAAVLGPGSGLWSPSLAAGVETQGRRGRERRPVLVVTTTRAAASQALRAAQGRGLRLLGAVCTGPDDGPISWADVVTEAAFRDPAPVVLVHLQCPVTAAALARVAALEADVVLVDGVPEPVAGLNDAAPTLVPEMVARALGLVVVDSMAEAAEAAFLLGRGVRRHGATVLGVARDLEEAALLEDALRRGGVTADIEDQTHGERVDCLLQLGAGEVPAGHAAVRLAMDGDPTPAPHRATEATLWALSALQTPRRWRPNEALRRPRVRAAEARHLLDGWRAALDELQVKELLRCYGLRGPAEELTSSASGASRAARDLGFPVAVKAVGPGLTRRLPRGMVALNVDNESAVRQAFREVANACGALDPAPLLEGVLVSALAPLPATLDFHLVWPPHSPPLLVAVVRVAHLGGVRLLPCPAGPEACEATAGDLLLRGDLARGPAQTRHLARFLSRLSWLGADLDGRMRWLRLDTVSPPAARTPPLVIDGCAEQNEGFRAPLL